MNEAREYFAGLDETTPAATLEQVAGLVKKALYVMDTAKGRGYIDPRNRYVDRAHKALKDASFAVSQAQDREGWD